MMGKASVSLVSERWLYRIIIDTHLMANSTKPSFYLVRAEIIFFMIIFVRKSWIILIWCVQGGIELLTIITRKCKC
jgi:hypothetical protein